MTKNIKLALFSILLFSAPVTFACDYPQRATVPDGATASKEEMIAGQKSVKAFMAEMEEYLSCIAAEEEAAVLMLEDPTPEIKLQRQNMLSKRHNAGVEDMEIIAAEFNNQVRAYKAKTD